MVSLEMIGFYTEKKSSQAYPMSILKIFYSTVGNYIGIVSNFDSSSLVSDLYKNMSRANLKVSTIKSPSFIRGVDYSDHRSFWEFGYKAVMITDTAFFRNHNYHRKTDTIDSLDFDKMSEVVKGVCWSLLNMK
jgi:hypothetical protein